MLLIDQRDTAFLGLPRTYAELRGVVAGSQ